MLSDEARRRDQLQGWLPLALAAPRGCPPQRSQLNDGVLTCSRDLAYAGAGGEYRVTVNLSLPAGGGDAELSCSDGEREWSHAFALSSSAASALVAGFSRRHAFTREMIGQALECFAASAGAQVPSFVLPAVEAAAMAAVIPIEHGEGRDRVRGHVSAKYFLDGSHLLRRRLPALLGLAAEVDEFTVLRGWLEPPDGVSMPAVPVTSLLRWGQHPLAVRLVAAAATKNAALRLVLDAAPVPAPAGAAPAGAAPAAASVVSASVHLLGQPPLISKVCGRRYDGGRVVTFEAPVGTGFLQMCASFVFRGGEWRWQVRGAHSEQGGLDLPRGMDYGAPLPVPVPGPLVPLAESMSNGWTKSALLDLLVRSVFAWRPDPGFGLHEVCATRVLSLPAALITVVAMAFPDGATVPASSASISAFEAVLSKCALDAGHSAAVELTGRWSLDGAGDDAAGDLPDGLFMHSAAGAALLHAALVTGRSVYVELADSARPRKRARLD